MPQRVLVVVKEPGKVNEVAESLRQKGMTIALVLETLGAVIGDCEDPVDFVSVEGIHSINRERITSIAEKVLADRAEAVMAEGFGDEESSEAGDSE